MRPFYGALLLLFSLSGLGYVGYAISLKSSGANPALQDQRQPPQPAPAADGHSWEKQTLQSLEALRRALDAYKADNGSFPPSPAALVPRQLAALPEIKTAENERPSSAVRLGSGNTLVTNAGGWAYVNDPAGPDFGKVCVNSVGRDSAGVQWFAR